MADRVIAPRILRRYPHLMVRIFVGLFTSRHLILMPLQVHACDVPFDVSIFANNAVPLCHDSSLLAAMWLFDFSNVEHLSTPLRYPNRLELDVQNTNYRSLHGIEVEIEIHRASPGVSVPKRGNPVYM